MPRSVTHEALVEHDDRTAVGHALFFEKILALPLNDAGGLGAVLLQMSPSFHNTGDSFETLSRFLGSLSVGEFHYALEFRHKSWLSDKHHLTSDSAYVRFHGRNFDIWYHDEKEDDERIDRYDYLYSDDQLQPWVPRIKEMEEQVSRVRVFFNNHGRAKSAKNALELMDMLNLPHKAKSVHVQDQAKIDEF